MDCQKVAKTAHVPKFNIGRLVAVGDMFVHGRVGQDLPSWDWFYEKQLDCMNCQHKPNWVSSAEYMECDSVCLDQLWFSFCHRKFQLLVIHPHFNFTNTILMNCKKLGDTSEVRFIKPVCMLVLYMNHILHMDHSVFYSYLDYLYLYTKFKSPA